MKSAKISFTAIVRRAATSVACTAVASIALALASTTANGQCVTRTYRQGAGSAKLAPALLPVLQQVPSSPQSVTPFTLVREIWSVQHDPKGELHRSQTIAVRSDGSRSATETTLAGELKRSLDFADGRRITQFLGLGVKNTWPSPDPAALAQRRAGLQAGESANCVVSGWTKAGLDTIQELPVTVLSHTSEDLAWKATRWSAPQLGCEDLKQLAYDVRADGSLALRTETKTVRLRLGEPDPALFDDRADFQEVTPFEAVELIVRKHNLPLTPEQIHDGLRLFENAYSGSARPRPR